MRICKMPLSYIELDHTLYSINYSMLQLTALRVLGFFPLPSHSWLRRLGFESRFFWLQIVSFYTRCNQNNRRKKNTQWILHVTTPLFSIEHTCLWSQTCTCSRSRVFNIYLHACTYSRRSPRMSLDSSSATVNLPQHPAKRNCLSSTSSMVFY